MLRIAWLAAALGLVASSGCTLCCTPYDDARSYYGGKWQDVDPYHGRLGSIFDPAGGAPVEHPYAEVEQAPTLAAPTPAAPRTTPPAPGGNSGAETDDLPPPPGAEERTPEPMPDAPEPRLETQLPAWTRR